MSNGYDFERAPRMGRGRRRETAEERKEREASERRARTRIRRGPFTGRIGAPEELSDDERIAMARVKPATVSRGESVRRLGVDTGREIGRNFARVGDAINRGSLDAPYLRERGNAPRPLEPEEEAIVITGPSREEVQRNLRARRGEEGRRFVRAIPGALKSASDFVQGEMRRLDPSWQFAMSAMGEPYEAPLLGELTGLPSIGREAAGGYIAERRGERELGGRAGARAAGQTALTASLAAPFPIGMAGAGRARALAPVERAGFEISGPASAETLAAAQRARFSARREALRNITGERAPSARALRPAGSVSLADEAAPSWRNPNPRPALGDAERRILGMEDGAGLSYADLPADARRAIDEAAQIGGGPRNEGAALSRTRVPVSDLPVDESVLPGRASQYAERLAAGDQAPAIVVRRTPEGLQIVDGRHRASAARSRGVESMDAVDATDFFNAPKPRVRGNASLPLAIGGGTALGLASAGEAEAQEGESPELVKINEDLAKLQAEAEEIRSAQGRGPAAIIAVQQKLNVPDDGAWERITREAANKRLEEIAAQAKVLTERRNDLEVAANRPDPIMDQARFWGPVGSFLAGGVLAEVLPRGFGRAGAVAKVRREMLERNRQANALLTDTPLTQPGRSAASRVAANQAAARRRGNLDQFFVDGLPPPQNLRTGVARRQPPPRGTPFRDANTELGYTARPQAEVADAATLYPPGARRFRGPDLGWAALGGVEAAAFIGPIRDAEQRLAVAEEAFANNQTGANFQRVEKAKNELAQLEAWQRLGMGYASGRLIAPFIHKYPDIRPNLDVARAERTRLNQYVNSGVWRSPTPRGRAAAKKKTP